MKYYNDLARSIHFWASYPLCSDLSCEDFNPRIKASSTFGVEKIPQCSKNVCFLFQLKNANQNPDPKMSTKWRKEVRISTYIPYIPKSYILIYFRSRFPISGYISHPDSLYLDIFQLQILHNFHLQDVSGRRASHCGDLEKWTGRLGSDSSVVVIPAGQIVDGQIYNIYRLYMTIDVL